MNIEINTETKIIIIKQPIKIDVLIKELKTLKISLSEYTIQNDFTLTYTYPYLGYMGDVDLNVVGSPHAEQPFTTSKAGQ